MVEQFVTLLGLTLKFDPAAFEDLRFWALFDDPIQEATVQALTRPDALESWGNRLVLSLLLDLSRSRLKPAPELLARLLKEDSFGPSVIEGLELVANTLDRIAVAMADRPSQLVLLGHGRGDRHLHPCSHQQRYDDADQDNEEKNPPVDPRQPRDEILAFSGLFHHSPPR